MEFDNVKNPEHYHLPNGLEVKDVIGHMTFFRASAIKYIFRAGKKSKEKEIEDLRKAIQNLEFEIKRIET